MGKICKVLIVEDNPDVRDLLGDLFGYEGFHFSCVAEGAAFRAELAKGDAEVAIIDIMIPGGENGLALAELAAGQGCGVILVTGHHDHFERLETYGHRYLLKPFSVGSLLDLVAETLLATQARCEAGGRRFG